MYCVKCGVELADSEKVCPLCSTVVYHPDLAREEAPSPYPPHRVSKRMRRRATLFVLALVSIALAAQLLLLDFATSKGLDWAIYADGGIALMYLMVCLPMWFRRPNPAIFVPTGFLAAALYVFLCCALTGGTWYFNFALPLIVGIAVIVTAVSTLCRYIRGGRYYIAGGTVIASGVYLLGVEILIASRFAVPFIGWSIYSLVSFLVLGMGLIVIGIVPAFRHAFDKKFFI